MYVTGIQKCVDFLFNRMAVMCIVYTKPKKYVPWGLSRQNGSLRLLENQLFILIMVIIVMMIIVD